MNTRFGEWMEKLYFWCASNIVGFGFLVMGVQATLSISENVVDTCNIWSFFYISGLWLGNHSNLYSRIAQKITPMNATKHRAGWKFAVEFAWMLISLLIASAISNWMWVDQKPEMLELTTNGCSLFVMGITSFMLYQNYTE